MGKDVLYKECSQGVYQYEMNTCEQKTGKDFNTL
jgi:hypothetical protein